MAEFEFSSDWGYSDDEREIARNTALRIITRAMWYSYLGDLARLGVRLEPDDVLHMGRSSELMGRLLCEQ